METKHKSYKKCKFGECAMDLGFLDRDQIDYAASRQAISKQRFGHICVQEGFINRDQAAEIIARQYDYPYVEITELPDSELLNLVPLELMLRFRFVPYTRQGDELVIAMPRPRDLIRLEHELDLILDLRISAVVVSEERIEVLLKKLESSRSYLDSISDDMRLPIIREEEGDSNDLTPENVTGEESLTVKLVNSTILDAIHKRSSDIHIESSDIGVIIRYRIDGMLYQATDPLDIQYQSPIISRIKVMSELDISEKRVPQDGRFKIKVKDRAIDFRVSILPTVFGEDAVIRILDRESLAADTKGMFRLDEMGLPDRELIRIRRMIRAPYGMFLMTGPTGSGKTTTLYRALSEVQSEDVKTITIEDPVEYQLKGIVQIPVNEKKGLTFARGLRSILRHDPDKILVGEIRDSETAQIAIQSALTGHLVFTTVHANRSIEVINRFIHMGIEPFNLMSALNCIIAQRLIRTLCPCKAVADISERELVESGVAVEACRDRVFFKPKGCESCKGTGFRGRKAIIEMVELDDELRELFIRMAPASELKRKAKALGTTFLRAAALREVFRGFTTLEEANRVTFVENDLSD